MTVQESIDKYGYALVTTKHSQILADGNNQVEQIAESGKHKSNFRMYRVQPHDEQFKKALLKHRRTWL